MLPLVSLALYLPFCYCFTIFLLSVLPFCVMSSSRDFGLFFLSLFFPLYILSLFMALSHSFPCPFSSSSSSVESPSATALGVPWLGVIIDSQGVAICPPANYANLLLVQLFGYIMERVFLHHGIQNRLQIPLNHGSFLRRFCFPFSGAISVVRSRASRSDAIRTFRTVEFLDL